MSFFEDTTIIDVDTYAYLKFSLVKIKKYYNLYMTFISESGDNPLTMRTSIYALDIPDMTEKLRKLLSSNAYDHLIPISISEVVDENDDLEFEFDFDDYGSIDDYEDGLQAPTIS